MFDHAIRQFVSVPLMLVPAKCLDHAIRQLVNVPPVLVPAKCWIML